MQDFKEYVGFGDSLAFVSDYLTMHGPFDGLLGFSQVGQSGGSSLRPHIGFSCLMVARVVVCITVLGCLLYCSPPKCKFDLVQGCNQLAGDDTEMIGYTSGHDLLGKV